MSWRGKYIGWYRIAHEMLEKLVPDLTNQEIMENVTTEDQLVVPVDQEQLPRNKTKALPQLSIRLSDTSIELGILYHEQEQLELFKNIFRETNKRDMKKLLEEIQGLNSSYETILYSRGRDEKPLIQRKYVSARMDTQLIERIIEESEKLRRGGRQIQNNQSVYIPPKTPELYLTRISIPPIEVEYRKALKVIKPLFAAVTGIKTQREIISERLRKPMVKRNLYREFIETLNEVRRCDLISAERRREINQKWRDNVDERDELMEMLRELLISHS